MGAAGSNAQPGPDVGVDLQPNVIITTPSKKSDSHDYKMIMFFLLFIVIISVMGYMLLKVKKLESLTSPILQPII